MNMVIGRRGREMVLEFPDKTVAGKALRVPKFPQFGRIVGKG